MSSGDFPVTALETRADWGYTTKDNLSNTIKAATTFNIGGSSLTLTSSVAFPSQGFILIDSEICFYGANNTGTGVLSSIVRGLQGTTEANHTAGTTVYLADSGGSINRMAIVIEALCAKVGINDSAVATTLDFLLKNTTSGHDHDGSDSKKVDHVNLNNKGTNTHAQVDSHIASGAHVTGGDSHDHSGGDGASIPTGGLENNAVTQRSLTQHAEKYNPSTAWADVTQTIALDTTLTLTGGDVYLSFSCAVSHPTNPQARVQVRILRGSTQISYSRTMSAGVEVNTGYGNTLCFDFIDAAPAAGSTTYRIQIKQPDGTSLECVDRQFIVFEMKK